MEPKVKPINRRTFLRLAAYSLPALAALRPNWGTVLVMPLSPAYGAGPYGGGAYSGYAVYLPAVIREGA
jgi:hypothetical protein